MNKFKKLIKEFSLKSDIINTIVGIILIVSLIFILQNPRNHAAILTACISGGLINILNGFNLMKNPKKMSTGMSFLMMGIILIVLGFIIINLS
ncbi:MAG: hypothetical protein PHF63_11260 [Herbinix sp.]|nr:hypothetical protein [Herbinix sp.]